MRSKLITDYIINRCANPNSEIFVDVQSKDGDFCPFDQPSAHGIFYVDEATGHRSDILSKALIEKVQSASSALLNHPILSQLPSSPSVPEATQAEVGVKSRYISSLSEESRYAQMLADTLQEDASPTFDPPAPAPEPPAPASESSASPEK